MGAGDDIYLGNPLLKKANVKIDFTKEQVEEYVKCANDPVYFTKNYVPVSYTHLTLPTICSV